jgi:hypothetical protein
MLIVGIIPWCIGDNTNNTLKNVVVVVLPPNKKNTNTFESIVGAVTYAPA